MELTEIRPKVLATALRFSEHSGWTVIRRMSSLTQAHART